MRKAHLMESIQAWIEKFIEQAQQKSSQSTKDYPTSYRNLRVKVSFGYGNLHLFPGLHFWEKVRKFLTVYIPLFSIIKILMSWFWLMV